jgi:hypothetical protein
MCSSAMPAGGTIPIVSMIGRSARSGSVSSSPSALSPRKTSSSTAKLCPRSGSGTTGSGGNCSIRPTEVTSSGTVRVQSSQARRTSAERSQGKNIAPA